MIYIQEKAFLNILLANSYKISFNDKFHNLQTAYVIASSKLIKADFKFLYSKISTKIASPENILCPDSSFKTTMLFFEGLTWWLRR